MTSAESAELGSILKRLVPALKIATGAHRVYFLALMGARAALPPLARAEEEAGTPLRGGLPGPPSCPRLEERGKAISRKIRRQVERSPRRPVTESEKTIRHIVIFDNHPASMKTVPEGDCSVHTIASISFAA